MRSGRLGRRLTWQRARETDRRGGRHLALQRGSTQPHFWPIPHRCWRAHDALAQRHVIAPRPERTAHSPSLSGRCRRNRRRLQRSSPRLHQDPNARWVAGWPGLRNCFNTTPENCARDLHPGDRRFTKGKRLLVAASVVPAVRAIHAALGGASGVLRPSTGLMGVGLALATCRRVELFGFANRSDTRRDADCSHYFSCKKNQSRYARGGFHDWVAHWRLLQSLIDDDVSPPLQCITSTDFRLRMPHATSAADALQFQSWLHARQYPADCRQSVGIYTRQDYFFALGLGAQLVSLKYGLLHALLNDRVYHFPTSHYVNQVRCPSRSFDCYFERPSNCSRPKGPKGRMAARPVSEHGRAMDVKIHWCFDLPRRKLTRLAGLRAVYPGAWYHAQLSAFLFRPNAELRAFGRQVLADMEYARGENRSRTRASRNGSGCVAMHVRRTDKHTEDHRTRDRGFKEFGQTFKSWAYWEHDGPQAQLKVLLGSEDKNTFTAMPPLLLPSAAYWIPARHFVMDMTPGKTFKDIKQGNSRLGQLYGGIEDQLGPPHARPPRAELQRRGLLKDEGQVLILQILLMSDCRAFIGSYSSNVAILVHDLMQARRIALREPLHSLDVNGRVYCGCGASFCMQLERKATRDPSKTVRQMVDAFRY